MTWHSHLNTKYPLGQQCESGHCGKDAGGLYAPATWVVTHLDEDAYGEEDKELEFGVCDTCINIYKSGRRTRTKTILRVMFAELRVGCSTGKPGIHTLEPC